MHDNADYDKAVDPVVEAVARRLHDKFIGPPYVRWSCWLDAEEIIALVRDLEGAQDAA